MIQPLLFLSMFMLGVVTALLVFPDNIDVKSKFYQLGYSDGYADASYSKLKLTIG